MPNPPFSFLVQDIYQESPNAKRYSFDYGLTPFEFYPGQFSVLTLPSSTTPQTAAITLACSPLRRQNFEFVVVRTGDFGTKFYDTVQIGDLVPMQAPAGKFHLEIFDPRPILFIAYDYCVTGTRAFWQYHQDVQMSKDFVFVHPYRGHGQALFKNEFESTSSSNRKYVPLELPANPEVMLNPNFLSQAIQSLPDSLIYLTGEGKDVMNLKKTLESLGKNPQSIRTERWS